jgi:hypothetical protein
MRDDKIQSFGRRAFDDIQGRHHGDGDPRHRGVWVAGFKCIDRLGLPRRADLLLYLGHDFAGGDRLLLRTGRCCSSKDDRKPHTG